MFKKKAYSFLILTLAVLVMGAGCNLDKPKQTKDDSSPNKDKQKQSYTLEESKQVAKDWIKTESPTYSFDGSKLTLEESKETGGEDCSDCYQFTFNFESSHGGYGDRSDKMITQVITPHTMVVDVKHGVVIEAITDGKFDEMKAEMVQKKAKATSSTSSAKSTGQNNNTSSMKSQSNNTTSQKNQNNSQTNSTKDIKLTNLGSNDLVPKLFAIRGTAPAEWFFEGDFPIEVHPPGSTSNPYTTAIAKTDEDYMTKDRVSFYAVVDMRGESAQDIIVQFKKDNPSGKKELDDSENIGLRLEQAKKKTEGTIAKGIAKDGCVISGCANQFCASKGKVGSCSTAPKYQCRRSGICSKDSQGNCRWLQDSAMKSCLNKAN